MSDPERFHEDTPAAGDSRRDRAVRKALTGLGLLGGLWAIVIVSGVLGFRPFPEIPFVSDGPLPASIWIEAVEGEDQAESEPPPSAPAESDSESGGLTAPVPILAAASPLTPAAVAPRPDAGAPDGRPPRSRGRRGSKNPGSAPGASEHPPAQPPGNSVGNGSGNAYAYGHTQAQAASSNGNAYAYAYAYGHTQAASSNGNGNAYGHTRGKGNKH